METTQDYFYKGKVSITQHKKGYRFSVDAPLLADFLPQCLSAGALEIGTGCGIISMLALYKRKFSRIYALELQEPLCRLARINAEKNGFTPNFQVIPGDFNETYTHFDRLEHIFSNPPYFTLTHGRLSPNPEIRHAKAETKLTLRQLLEKSHRILGPKGNLYLVLPYERYDECLRLATDTGFSIARRRKVFSFKDGRPERFLVQLSILCLSPQEMEPLIIFKEKGIYTDEMDEILTG